MQASDVVFIIACLLIGACLEIFPGDGPNRFFLERDPTLSYPLVHSTVPVSLLVVLTLLLPSLALAALQWLGLFSPKVTHGLLQGALFFGHAMQFATVNCIKCYCGRLRPNFFALCDYKGYAATFDSEVAMASYLDATKTGRIGDASGCLKQIHQSHLSFPSGHSSWSLAGLGFLALCMCGIVKSRKASGAWQTCAVAGPLSVALWICCTRLRDYWHNFDDVVAGAAIGALAAYWAFSIHVAPLLLAAPSNGRAIEQELSADYSESFAGVAP